MNCIGSVLGGMLERGSGHIVNMSSDAGRKVYFYGEKCDPLQILSDLFAN